MKKYDIIYADPPWPFRNKKTGGSMKSGAETNYKTMSIVDICNLNIQSISNDDSVLFMWWVSSMPEEAIYVANSWGYTVKTMTAFTWIKKTVNWKDHFGMGFYTRQQAENVLLAVKGKPAKQSNSVRQLIRARIGRHSEKPNEVRQEIVKLYGDIPRIELFARDRFYNWDTWGDQCPCDVKL